MPMHDDVADVEKLSPEQLAMEKLRHTAAHVMAQAVRRLWPQTRLAIGPTIENGFFYDMDIPAQVTAEDLPRIEEEMRKVTAANFALERELWPKDKALEFFGSEPFKTEIIQGLDDGSISVYRQGEFTDLCRGPHLPATGELRHFKLTSVAGAYWRGDERNPMLTRIYGTAFPTAEALAEHLRLQEEAKARDHRKLGRELGLISFHPQSPAMPFFHPKGASIYNQLVAYVRDIYREEGYSEVVTPQIFDTSLWKTSGHYDNYIENMFLVELDEREFGVKPMNCPAHCLMFGESKWSYRELPVRYADFGRLHRYERSGVTQGLTRVRSFAQDDGHIYCTPDQIAGEIQGVVRMIRKVYADFGFGEPRVYFSTKPAKAVGSDEVWARAEAALQSVLESTAIPYKVNPGDGAFYGPKIDFCFTDAIQREWQLSTIQLDFNLPERFDLSYTTSESASARPVMIHRAVLGSVERFLGILIEHFAGAFPPWIAPVQARVLPLNDDLLPYAREVAAKLRQAGLRVEIDERSEKIGKKIRDAQLEKVPWQLVVGKREAAEGQVSVRLRQGGDQGARSVDAFLAEALEKVRAKALSEAPAVTP